MIRPVSTQVFLITPAAKGEMLDPHNRMRLELQAPLEIESSAILSMDDATSSGDRTAENIGNAIGFLAGVGGSKRRAYDVKVDPDLWQADVSDALKQVSVIMTTRLKGLL